MSITHPLVATRNQLRAGQEDSDYKRELLDLFRDYRHPWDILTEIIQNSVDAINLNSSIGHGSVKIKIDSNSRSVTISDNGIGIASDNIEKVLLPNVSVGKSSARTFGYKGVGLSFASHLTRRFVLETISEGKRSGIEINNSIDWVAGRSGVDVEKRLWEVEHTSEPSGTTITLVLDGRYSDTELRTLSSLDDFFVWAANDRVLEYVLRTRTAIGNTAKYFGLAPEKDITVSINIDDGGEKAIDFSYLSPFETSYAKANRYYLTSNIDRKPAYADVYMDPMRTDSQKSFRCLRHDYPEIEVGVRLKTKVSLSVIACGETAVTALENEYGISDLPNDRVKNSLSMGTGVYLSIGSMPTAIKIHQWTDGFNKRFFCLAEVGMEANGELDKGRKGIGDYTRNLIIEEAEKLLNQKIVGREYSLRKVAHRMMTPQSRGYGGTDIVTHLSKWDSTTDILSGYSFSKAPLDENAVIALFYEAIGRNEISGYNCRYISQDATFDFAFEFRIDDDRLDSGGYSISRGYVDMLAYDLADTNWRLKNSHGDFWHVGEFKIAAEDIVGSEKQSLQELDLLVVWDFDEDKVTARGGMIIKCNADQRKYDGVTHILRDTEGQCQVIVLKDLLNDAVINS